jgi:hypothetical protein
MGQHFWVEINFALNLCHCFCVKNCFSKSDLSAEQVRLPFNRFQNIADVAVKLIVLTKNLDLFRYCFWLGKNVKIKVPFSIGRKSVCQIWPLCCWLSCVCVWEDQVSV